MNPAKRYPYQYRRGTAKDTPSPLDDILAQYGRGGDSLVAHISPKEAEILRMMGGSGTINPKTGMLQFDDSDENDDSNANSDASMPGGYEGFGLGIGDPFGVDASLAPSGAGPFGTDASLAASGGSAFGVDPSLSPSSFGAGSAFAVDPALSPSTITAYAPEEKGWLEQSRDALKSALGPKAGGIVADVMEFVAEHPGKTALAALSTALGGVPGLMAAGMSLSKSFALDTAKNAITQGWQDTKDMTPAERAAYYADARAAAESMDRPDTGGPDSPVDVAALAKEKTKIAGLTPAELAIRQIEEAGEYDERLLAGANRDSDIDRILREALGYRPKTGLLAADSDAFRHYR